MGRTSILDAAVLAAGITFILFIVVQAVNFIRQ